MALCFCCTSAPPAPCARSVAAVESPSVNVALLAELTDATGGLLWHHRGDSPALQASVQSAMHRRWGSSGERPGALAWGGWGMSGT